MRAAGAALVLAALAACASSPSPVPGLLAPRDGALAELQVRRFEAAPGEMLPAALAALQDLGFQVTGSDAALGLVVARRSYRKSFEELSQDFWPGFSQAMKNAFTFRWSAPPPAEAALLAGPAAFNAAVVVAPQGSGSTVRVAFHRSVGKPTGEPIVMWAEELRDPRPYTAFFEQLARELATKK